MKLFALLMILFAGNQPVRTEMYLGEDPAECEKAKAKVDLMVKGSGLTARTRCIEVDRDTKPQVDPKHRDPKSEKAT